MSPRLRDGDLVLIRKSAYTVRSPRRGELVAARPRSLAGRALVKRVAGLPHEHIAQDGQVWRLGRDEYFLIGENREESLDSRTLGPIMRAELIGRVWMRLWPPKTLSVSQHENRPSAIGAEVNAEGGNQWANC